ncbi:MAG: serine protease, partial [Planctomycetota bacterium]
MNDKLGRFFLRSLCVISLSVGVGVCAFQEIGVCATNKPSADTDALAAAQNFEKAFQQVVEQVKPAVVSITSVKV